MRPWNPRSRIVVNESEWTLNKPVKSCKTVYDIEKNAVRTELRRKIKQQGKSTGDAKAHEV